MGLEMKSVLFAIVAIAALAYVVWTRESHSDEWAAPAWAKAYHTCGTFGATDGDCEPPKTDDPISPYYHDGYYVNQADPSGLPYLYRVVPKRGDLYAFCDAEQTDPCDTRALMLKDVCEDTIRTYTDGSARFTCAPVSAAARDAYLATLEPDKLTNTFRAWREGR